MFKIALAVSIATLLLLAVSGCIQQAEEQPFWEGPENALLELPPISDTTIPPNPAPIPGNCSAVKTQFDKDLCAFATALEQNEVESCISISNLSDRNDCVAAVASQNLDTSLCDFVESAFHENNTNVKNWCISKVALETLYTKECRQSTAQQWETRCWSKALSVCNEITSQEWRELCIKKIAIEVSDSETCLLLHGFERDTCLEEIAVANQDMALCNQIGEETIRESCMERASVGPFSEEETREVLGKA